MGDREKWDLGMNYAKDLDDNVANDYPIICIDNSGHQALCNGYALKKAKLIDNDYKKLIGCTAQYELADNTIIK